MYHGCRKVRYARAAQVGDLGEIHGGCRDEVEQEAK